MPAHNHLGIFVKSASPVPGVGGKLRGKKRVGDEEDEEKDEPIGQPAQEPQGGGYTPRASLLPLGLAGVGAAGLGGAYGISTDQHAADLRKALGQIGTPLQPGETHFNRYTDIMSRAAQSRPFGLDPKEVITRLREMPGFIEAVGASPDYMVKDPDYFQGTRAHYGAFGQGPIPASWHMSNSSRDYSGYTDDVMRVLREQNRPALSDQLLNGQEITDDLVKQYGRDRDWVTNHIKLKNLQEEITKRYTDAFREEMSPQYQSLIPYETDLSHIPHEQQVAFQRRFHANLPEHLRQAKEVVENDVFGPSLENNLNNYIPPTEAALDTRDTLKNVGLTSLGAAGGGAIGHLLHDAMGGNDDDDTVDWTDVLATTGGAGLGGLGTYYLGTESGRKSLGENFQSGLDGLLAALAGGGKVE